MGWWADCGKSSGYSYVIRGALIVGVGGGEIPPKLVSGLSARETGRVVSGNRAGSPEGTALPLSEATVSIPSCVGLPFRLRETLAKVMSPSLASWRKSTSVALTGIQLPHG